jgi:general secretion pathway protein B
MSYILDALRKADAERERGSVPGLHTQAMPPASAPRPASRAGVPVSWVASAVIVVVAGGLAWAWLGHDGDTPPAAARVADAAPAVAAVTPAPTPVPAVATPAPSPAAPPAPLVAPTAATPAPVVVPREPLPLPAPRPAPAPKQHTVAKPSTQAKTVPVALGASSAASAAAPAASAAPAKVYAVNDLPPDVRRDWPQLSIGGSIYSETPASRFLIINGQIHHEGDTIANGLTLEEIKLKAAVLRYKGYRVGITF